MQQVNFDKLQSLDFRSNEAYKSLRANILFCGSDVKSICFTSCLPNEGKSNVSFNLAVSFAESGKRVIFIDADLRRSVIVGRYRPDKAINGLVQHLSGLNSLNDTTYKTNIENLDIIFTGPVPPNPSELLGGKPFQCLISSLRENYDIIIIDTPPLGSVIDSAIVAGCCDGAVLVVGANSVSYKLAQRVKNQLQKGNCKILGAILNKVDLNSGEYRYYGRKYENDYYSMK